MITEPEHERERLISELAGVVGEKYVLHRPDELIVYEYDSAFDTALPRLIVLPVNTAEVAAVVKIASRWGAAIVPRGAGTGLSGGAIACHNAIVIGFSRLNRILEIDTLNRVAVVQPGVVNIHLSNQLLPYGFFYAPDPSSQRACTIGGNVAENSGGPHCLLYGVTTNHILGLEVVLTNGEIVRLGGRTGGLPGYDLVGLMVGSEGTLGIVTEVTTRILPFPPATHTFLVAFPDLIQACRAVTAIISAGILPAALEMIDNVTTRAVEAATGAGYPVEAGGILLIDLDGLPEELLALRGRIESLCRDEGAAEVRMAETPQARELLWRGRKGALSALGRVAPHYYINDTVVPRTKLPAVLAEVLAIAARYELVVANVFHAGDGNLHPTIMFDSRVPGATERVMAAGEEIVRVCVSAGGTITGEHGIGLEKRNFMSLIFNEEDLAAMRTLRRVFDPTGLLNPGKLFPSRRSCGEIPSSTGLILETEAYF